MQLILGVLVLVSNLVWHSSGQAEFPGDRTIRYFKIIFITDAPDYIHLVSSFQDALRQINSEYADGNVQLQSSVIDARGRRLDAFHTDICADLTTSTAALLAVGSSMTTNFAAVVGEYYGVPVLTYSTRSSRHGLSSPQYPVIQFDGSVRLVAKLLMQLLAKNSWFYLTLIDETTLMYDGFVDVINNMVRDDKRWKIESRISLRSTDTLQMVSMRMSQIKHETRVIVMHCNKFLAAKVFAVATVSGLLDGGYAWFISPNLVTADQSHLRNYPLGLLTLRLDKEETYTEDVIYDMVKLTQRSLTYHLSEYLTYFIPTGHGCSQVLRKDFGHGRWLYRIMKHSAVNGRTGPVSFDAFGSRNEVNISMDNLIRKKNSKLWIQKGMILNGNISQHRVNTIVWPGNTIRGPLSMNTATVTVVTTIIKPFVLEQDPFAEKRCMAYTPCLRLSTKDRYTIAKIFEDYHRGIVNPERPYRLKCCKGYSVDVLNKLANDLNFKFQMYIVSDNKSGAYNEDTKSWNGLVADVLSGAADLAIAAFSITGSRSRAIAFTTPYFFSGFSMMTAERKRPIPLLAYLEPFARETWVSIFGMATFTAVCMALFEWNSPFGLNPWGRKRKANYTLASAFNAVYAIWFGHTVKTKTPKSWPCKLVQNFWAGVAIYIVASYTANLAAFIAGKTALITYSGIGDKKLLKLKVGVKGSTALETYVGIISPRLYKTVIKKHTVSDNSEGFQLLRDGRLDFYLGDTPVLEFHRSEHDHNCTLKMKGRSFGEDGYGIGLPKDSWLQERLSQKIIEYHKTGYLERLQKNYFYVSALCGGSGHRRALTTEDIKLRLPNHAGLYATLACGIVFASFILLPLEHVIFTWVVPYIRQKPGKSRWKNINVMFVSQRLYRIVTSQEIVSGSLAFKEMLAIIKSRHFSRVFQKSHRKEVEQQMKKNMQMRKFNDIIQKLKLQNSLEKSDSEEDSVIGKGTLKSNQISDVGKLGRMPSNPLFSEMLTRRRDSAAEHVSLKQGGEDEDVQRTVAMAPAIPNSSSLPNGRLPSSMLLTPVNFMPWNCYGSEADLRVLVSSNESLQHVGASAARQERLGRVVAAELKRPSDPLNILHSPPSTLRTQYLPNLSQVALTEDETGAGSAAQRAIALEEQEFDQLSKHELMAVCLELNARLKSAAVEKEQLEEQVIAMASNSNLDLRTAADKARGKSKEVKSALTVPKQRSHRDPEAQVTTTSTTAADKRDSITVTDEIFL